MPARFPASSLCLTFFCFVAPLSFLPFALCFLLLLLLLAGFVVFPCRGGTRGVSQSGVGSRARARPGRHQGRAGAGNPGSAGARDHQGSSHPQLRVLTILRAGGCLALSSHGSLLVLLPAVSPPEPPPCSSPRFWHHQLLGSGWCHLGPRVLGVLCPLRGDTDSLGVLGLCVSPLCPRSSAQAGPGSLEQLWKLSTGLLVGFSWAPVWVGHLMGGFGALSKPPSNCTRAGEKQSTGNPALPRPGSRAGVPWPRESAARAVPLSLWPWPIPLPW